MKKDLKRMLRKISKTSIKGNLFILCQCFLDIFYEWIIHPKLVLLYQASLTPDRNTMKYAMSLSGA